MELRLRPISCRQQPDGLQQHILSFNFTNGPQHGKTDFFRRLFRLQPLFFRHVGHGRMNNLDPRIILGRNLACIITHHRKFAGLSQRLFQIGTKFLLAETGNIIFLNHLSFMNPP